MGVVVVSALRLKWKLIFGGAIFLLVYGPLPPVGMTLTDDPYDLKMETARKLKRTDNIEITVYLRNYMTGPIEDQFAIYTHDMIRAYVGPVNPDFARRAHPDVPAGDKLAKSIEGTIRAWFMVGVNDDGYQVCELQQIHNFGEYAFFSCPKPGVYRIYAWDRVSTTLAGGTEFAPPNIVQSEQGVNQLLSWSTRKGLLPFRIFNKVSGITGNVYLEAASNFQELVKTDLGNRLLTTQEMHDILRMYLVNHNEIPDNYAENVVAISEPIHVEDSTNCFYWIYHVKEKSRAGYVEETEVSPAVGTDGSSHLNIELKIWIAEPRAVPVYEVHFAKDKIKVSEYSKMLTKRYYTLGLFPCLRKAHPAIQIVKEIRFVQETDQDNEIQSPYWLAILKVHTDRLITTISDVSFTIAGRQNSALFGCFVGDTRVFIDTKTFTFVPQKILGRNSINLKLSKLQDVFRQKVQFQITQIYGHGVQYIGNNKARRYQPSTSRTDLVIVNNPCMAQEFAIAVGGSLYVAEALLARGKASVKQVYLPGLDDTNTPGKIQQANRYYLRVSDVAFTPTHFVILQTGGFIILHPTHIKHKGMGRMSSTGKHRPDSFVKRRWCGRTSTPKLSNMIVPAFSSQGSIIIVQIYSIEGSVHMWVNPPTQYCLTEGQKFIDRAEKIRANIFERTIHHNEFVKVNRSDERGIPTPNPDPKPVPPAPKLDRDEALSFLVHDDILVEDGSDPHFPADLANPASEVIGEDLSEYNSAVIYVLNDIDADKNKLIILLDNQDLNLEADSFDLHVMEFTAVEKQFIVGVKFQNKLVSDAFKTGDSLPLQMLITTITATNLPTKVKIPQAVRGEDEELDTLIPFPGMILLRSKPFSVEARPSRDPDENDGTGDRADNSMVEFRVKIYPVSTALPSYVLDLGNVLVFGSLDGRIARPLYFYEFCEIDKLLNPHRDPARAPNACDASHPPDPNPPTNRRKRQQPTQPQDNSTTTPAPGPRELPEDVPDLLKVPKINFEEHGRVTFYHSRLYDVVVTAQGIISVLWRKHPRRHLVQDDMVCLATEEGDEKSTIANSIAIGSVLINDGLRDIHGFFHNDNIFQMATPDGEIIYGKYNVKPHSPFQNCKGDYDPNDELPAELCIQQAKDLLPGQKKKIEVCSKSSEDSKPCRDPGYLKYCPDGNSTARIPDTEACLRLNNVTFVVKDCMDRFSEELGDYAWIPAPPGSSVPFVLKDERIYTKPYDSNNPPALPPGGPPGIQNPPPSEGRLPTSGKTTEECYTDTENKVTKCWPKHAPREELRDIEILGTSFYGYLHGSLKSVKSVHPEAPEVEKDEKDVEEELDVCPFIGFNVYNNDFDYADVGYETRITGVISFLGRAIPTEADLLVEYQPTPGAVVEISSSVEEQRDLTTITKTIDIKFVLTDLQLEEMQKANHDFSEEDFQDYRAREKSSVFSLTIRPSIVNMYCKNTDYFKTIQFSVGCNTFSQIHLISEAAPFWQFNWTTNNKEVKKELRWKLVDHELFVPKTQVFHLQVKEGRFNCSLHDDNKCHLPYYSLYGSPINPEIFTTSYRDPFFPKFEQFLTRSTRVVSGNMVLYDLLGSLEFDVNVTALDARCFSIADNWYDELRKRTQYITRGASEHEYIYRYYKDCFDDSDATKRVQSKELARAHFYVFNLTNKNAITFRRQRNHIYIFRAVLVNTAFNRFSYCKTLETFFLVRITGLPIPRHGLSLWIYVTIILVVMIVLIISYIVFYHFYTWKLDSTDAMPEKEGEGKVDGEVDEQDYNELEKRKSKAE